MVKPHIKHIERDLKQTFINRPLFGNLTRFDTPCATPHAATPTRPRIIESGEKMRKRLGFRECVAVTRRRRETFGSFITDARAGGGPPARCVPRAPRPYPRPGIRPGGVPKGSSYSNCFTRQYLRPGAAPRVAFDRRGRRGAGSVSEIYQGYKY